MEKYGLSCLFDQAQPTQLNIGARARVNFTNGTPLRLRVEPNLAATEIQQMPEGTQFDIVGGPACENADSCYRFWQLRLDDETVGWAAEADNTTYFIEPVPPATATPSATPTPTLTSTPTPTDTPTPTPTSIPTATFTPSATPTPAPVVLTPLNLQGWTFSTVGTVPPVYGFVLGPGTPPLGVGSLSVLISVANSKLIMRPPLTNITTVSSLLPFSYSTYRSTSKTAQFYVNLYLDTDGNPATCETRLDYAPTSTSDTRTCCGV